jgi:hypothetical protein
VGEAGRDEWKSRRGERIKQMGLRCLFACKHTNSVKPECLVGTPYACQVCMFYDLNETEKSGYKRNEER